METRLKKLSFHPFLCSYRTYEEWKRVHRLTSHIHEVQVLTVPMRNGNIPRESPPGGMMIGSYRTYEEWKLPSSSSTFTGCNVLTVPMRNGN